MNVDFIFDFASPNAYLCHKAIQNIEQTHDIKFNYVPCLLGGIMKLTNNQPPMVSLAEIPNKMKDEFETDDLSSLIEITARNIKLIHKFSGLLDFPFINYFKNILNHG